GFLGSDEYGYFPKLGVFLYCDYHLFVFTLGAYAFVCHVIHHWYHEFLYCATGICGARWGACGMVGEFGAGDYRPYRNDAIGQEGIRRYPASRYLAFTQHWTDLVVV